VAMLRMLMRLYRRIVTAPARSQRYRPERHYMRGAGPASRGRPGSDIRDPASPGTKAARHREEV
jgi:uncharacterized membrane-anchored protein